MRTFWPAAEPAQVRYEALRAQALAGAVLGDGAARRFERHGLAGLLTAPALEPLFTATVVGAVRPPWTPYTDPRVDALGAVYTFVLDVATGTYRAMAEHC
jgi:hypothetical protein